MPKDESPTLPMLSVGTANVIVESITGHGRSLATCAVRLDGQRVTFDQLDREAVMTFGLQLLQLGEQMIDARAYLTSPSVRDGLGVVSTRHSDGLMRFYRLRDRIPLLQLFQSVLESCDDETANGLLALTANVQATGRLPIKVSIGVDAVNEDDAQESALAAEAVPEGASTH